LKEIRQWREEKKMAGGEFGKFREGLHAGNRDQQDPVGAARGGKAVVGMRRRGVPAREF